MVHMVLVKVVRDLAKVAIVIVEAAAAASTATRSLTNLISYISQHIIVHLLSSHHYIKLVSLAFSFHSLLILAHEVLILQIH